MPGVSQIKPDGAFHHTLLDDEGEVGSRCDGSYRFTWEFFFLRSMTDEEVDVAVNWLAGQGGHCDCEVCMNLGPKYFPEVEKRSGSRAPG